MITWDDTTERYYQHGVDRGVLYVPNSDPVPWNGITGVDESGNGSSTMYYVDGTIYLADSDPTDYTGKLTAYFFPEEFAECIGMPKVADGLFVDNQKPKRFGLSYRSLIGSGNEGDLFGYQIHLIYNAMAVANVKQRRTISDRPEPMEFAFDIVATPVKMAKFRPTAHYVIDTRYLDSETVHELEEMLYGSDDNLTPGSLPDPDDLFELLSFGNAIEVRVYDDDEIYNVKGAASSVYLTGDGSTYQIDNINAVDNMDGTYTISDGGDTTVTIV